MASDEEYRHSDVCIGCLKEQALELVMRKHYSYVGALLRVEMPVKESADAIRAHWRETVEPLLADLRRDEVEDEVFDFSEGEERLVQMFLPRLLQFPPQPQAALLLRGVWLPCVQFIVDDGELLTLPRLKAGDARDRRGMAVEGERTPARPDRLYAMGLPGLHRSA